MIFLLYLRFLLKVSAAKPLKSQSIFVCFIWTGVSRVSFLFWNLSLSTSSLKQFQLVLEGENRNRFLVHYLRKELEYCETISLKTVIKYLLLIWSPMEREVSENKRRRIKVGIIGLLSRCAVCRELQNLSLSTTDSQPQGTYELNTEHKKMWNIILKRKKANNKMEETKDSET